jgi:Domain of unknown function (DUF4375)
MNSKYLPQVSTKAVNEAKETGDYDMLYDMLAQPLHEELYRKRSFDFMDDLSDGQQLLLAYDYVRMQVGQGGFIQFLHNGYVGLLPSMIEQLMRVGAADMAKVFDDVLKVYVLNRDLIERSATVEEFALLYTELGEFEGIDERYTKLNAPTIVIMLDYAVQHLNEFITPTP